MYCGDWYQVFRAEVSEDGGADVHTRVFEDTVTFSAGQLGL